jgi:hypothetical protein
MVRVPVLGGTADQYWAVELRLREGFDQGIPQSTVLVHRVQNGNTLLQASGGDRQFTAGEVWSGTRIQVRVDSIDTTHGYASVTILY